MVIAFSPQGNEKLGQMRTACSILYFVVRSRRDTCLLGHRINTD